MDDPNVIYYTFSTIPQVLAGAIALVGVFALYKLREIREDLKGIIQNFYDLCKKEEPPIVIEEKTYVLEAESNTKVIGKKIAEAIDSITIENIYLWDLYSDGNKVKRGSFDVTNPEYQYFLIDGGFNIITYYGVIKI